MGTDKTLRPFLDRVLIERVLERVRPVADELFVTTNHPERCHFLNIPCVPDVIPGRGALGGIYTALQAASSAFVAIIACDMPFVNSTLLAAEHERLVQSTCDAVIPRTADNQAQPFHGVYRRENCLPSLEIAIQDDQWQVNSWLSKLHTCPFLPEEFKKHDPFGLAFWNVNTPSELTRAEQMAREIEPPYS